jgi:hypothetical protein
MTQEDANENHPNGADNTAARLNRAAAIFAKMTESEHGIRPERIANADCICRDPRLQEGRRRRETKLSMA